MQTNDLKSFSLRIIKKLKPVLGFMLSVVFLNILMIINYPAVEFDTRFLLKISPEILIILSLICTAALLGIRFSRFFYVPLTAFVLFLRLFRIGDTLIPMYFFRPFNLFLDSQFLPDLIHLLYTTFTAGEFLLFAVLTIALLFGITTGVWISFKTIHDYLLDRVRRRIVVGLAISAIMSIYVLQSGHDNHRRNLFAQGFFHRVVEEGDFILHVQGYREQYLKAIDTTMKKIEQLPSSIDKLQRSSVFLFFIESYGHTMYAESRHFTKILPALNRLEKDLIGGGYGACSTLLNSPTFGGSSWLAHATLGSGVNLNSQMRYNLLITSTAKTIARLFNGIGYRTISVMPGTQWPWPEGEFFGYQKKYYAWDFDYKGPVYGWSTMPDQYVLDFIFNHEIQEQSNPLFIEFILTSSHAPFHRQPPYVEDWSQIGNGKIYHDLETITFPIIWPDLSNASEGYVTSIAYELKVIVEFINKFIDDDTLIIVMGDHQPNVQITGKKASWSVPIHVISRNRNHLQPFLKRGYATGFIPTQPMPHRGMETFLPDFLEDFSTPDK
jgi:hypothetical protein